ncbi:MAG TPA: putative Ig domain-containing protein, partial [Sedimentisphaerales bacterium]
ISATDADGNTITYSAQSLPSGATFVGQTFSWTPDYNQAGTYQVTFIASDGNAQGSETITITVSIVGSTNRPPVLAAIGNKSVNENSTLSFSISATDADGDPITYSAQNLPSGATFVGQTFSWTPDYNRAGTYQVTFIASDGKAQDSKTITITVNNVNRPPVLATIGNKSINEKSTLSFSISATDADSDPITYSAQNLPSGATFVGQTFSWTPDYIRAGTYQVTFIASDGQAQDSKTITITVNKANQAPVLSKIDDKSVYTNNLLAFNVNATDPDGDTVTYSATGLPIGATFAGQSFRWTPAPNQAGTYHVNFIASDGRLQDSETITIIVYSTDTSAPTVSGLSPAADSIQMPLDRLVILHVADNGEGVDANSVTIKVNDNIVYTGDTANYNSSYGRCHRTGAKADYTFIYQPHAAFDYDQKVSVVVNAQDLAGNAMSQYSYSFVTETRSFGENKMVNSRSKNLGKGHPAAVRDSAGNIWVAWHAGLVSSSGMKRGIYVGKLPAGADNFGTSVRVANNPSDRCNAALAIDAYDKLYLAWQDNRRKKWDIYMSTSVDGINWSTETRVTDSDNNAVNPVITVDHSLPPKAYIAWQDDRAGNQEIYIASSSDGFATETISRITSDSSDHIKPAIAMDSANTVYVVWTDSRNGSSGIYGAASNNGPWA